MLKSDLVITFSVNVDINKSFFVNQKQINKHKKALTGSSSLKATEKKRMKRTAEVLVMVYLKRQKIMS